MTEYHVYFMGESGTNTVAAQGNTPEEAVADAIVFLIECISTVGTMKALARSLRGCTRIYAEEC